MREPWRAREVIDSGKSSTPPPETWRSERLADLPAAASEPARARSIGKLFYGAPPDAAAETEAAQPDPAVDPGQQAQQQEQPDAAGTALQAEFDDLVAGYNLDQAEASELMALHNKAVEGWYKQHEQQVAAWKAQSEREFSASQLSDIRNRFERALGNDVTAQRFKAELARTGLGSHPATIAAISRLLGRR